MNDPLWSDGEQHPPDDDLHNWLYYTENFDTIEEEGTTASASSNCRPRSQSGLRTADTSNQTFGTSVASGDPGVSSSPVTFSPLHQSMDCPYFTRTAATVPSMTHTDERKPAPLNSIPTDNYDNAAAMADPRAWQSAPATVSAQYARTPSRRPKSLFDSGDDSLSPLPLKYTQMRSSPNQHQSSIAPLPMAPVIFRIGHGDPLEPPFTYGSLHQQGEAATTVSSTMECFEQQSMATRQLGSQLSLLRPQTPLCKPLTGYNYFYRDEKNSIVQHLAQPGDPLPDPVSDFSAHKMEQLLHQHWYVFSAKTGRIVGKKLRPHVKRP
jgi:hypothetical protein